MKKVINCYKDNNPVINKKLRKVSVDEGFKIAEELFRILNERKDGIGLAANQVGIDASVAVVNVREPLILINPVIKEQWDEIEYYEGCLSYPKKGIRTKRYKNIIIQTEQEESGWYFSGAETGKEGNLNGMTIHDRKIDTTIRAEKKIGRNQKVLIACGTDSRVVKYKKAIPLLENGWTLVES